MVLESIKIEGYKSDFNFFSLHKTKEIKLKTSDLIKDNLPKILIGFKWKKSMKWGSYDLNWARPLKSVLCLFDKKVIKFSLNHLTSSNLTYIDKDFEEKKKTFNDYKTSFITIVNSISNLQSEINQIFYDIFKFGFWNLSFA